MRIGTWNVWLGPRSESVRGQTIAAWLDRQDADIWLLTEIHRDWEPRGDDFVVSPKRAVGREDKRWAGIDTRLPFGQLDTVGDAGHPGEEGLCLGRMQLDKTEQSVLVACSVLPWKGAGKYWPGLPPGQVGQFVTVLEHHVARIDNERRPGEPLIWGGDFNQPLIPPFDGFTYAAAAALAKAFDSLGLVALTEKAESLKGTSFAIDHLAVSRELASGEEVAVVHRPVWDGGQLSDHAAYTAELAGPPPTG